MVIGTTPDDNLDLALPSHEERVCEVASYDWTHVGGVRDGDVFNQRQRCARCRSNVDCVSIS